MTTEEMIMILLGITNVNFKNEQVTDFTILPVQDIKLSPLGYCYIYSERKKIKKNLNFFY